MVESEVKRIHSGLTKDKDIYDAITKVEDNLVELQKTESKNIVTKVMESLQKQEVTVSEVSFTVDRANRMYQRIKEEMVRHETLCFELAEKFEAQHDLICQVCNNMDALKDYTIVNDLHMEAY
jgi:methyl-accepting chemotaxis protein